MSLVSTYVRATDGYFYQDPVLSGDGWFVCFDDDDPPELVIDKSKKLNPIDVLDGADISWEDIKLYADYAERDFSMIEHQYEFKPANAYWFNITRALNPEYIKEFGKRVKRMPYGVVYDFDNTKGDK